MRRILDHRDAARVAERHDRVHVRGMAAHVADDDRRDVVVELGGEIGHVDAVIVAHLASTGTQSACTTAEGTAAKVKAGISTRAPRGRPSAFSDRNSAAEQDETASAYFGCPSGRRIPRSSSATGASSGAV
jgi:hypothetical protein